MDAFTTKVHQLVTVLGQSMEDMAWTIFDVYKAAIQANNICELIWEEWPFEAKGKVLNSAITDAIEKLAKEHFVEIVERDKAWELEMDGKLQLVESIPLGERFVFLKKPMVRPTKHLTGLQYDAIRYAVRISTLCDPRSLCTPETVLDFGKWVWENHKKQPPEPTLIVLKKPKSIGKEKRLNEYKD